MGYDTDQKDTCFLSKWLFLLEKILLKKKEKLISENGTIEVLKGQCYGLKKHILHIIRKCLPKKGNHQEKDDF